LQLVRCWRGAATGAVASSVVAYSGNGVGTPSFVAYSVNDVRTQWRDHMRCCACAAFPARTRLGAARAAISSFLGFQHGFTPAWFQPSRPVQSRVAVVGAGCQWLRLGAGARWPGVASMSKCLECVAVTLPQLPSYAPQGCCVRGWGDSLCPCKVRWRGARSHAVAVAQVTLN
jgi:hypothetical protein